MALLGRDKRKPVSQSEAHLIATHTEGSHPRTIFFTHPYIANVAHQVKILFHAFCLLSLGD